MNQETPVKKPATVHLVLLGLLLLITAAYFIKHVEFVSDYLAKRVGAVRPPILMQSAQPVVYKSEEEATKAGVLAGDTVLELEGKPYLALGEAIGAIAHKHPGEALEVAVLHKSGGPVQRVKIPLVSQWEGASDYWVFVVTLHVLLPLLCMGLGFSVVALRPREKLAWVLLGLLVGFSQIFGLSFENQDGSLISNLALGYKMVFSSTWVLWLFVLGVYFPEQLGFERRHPWLKWLGIVPLSALAVVGVIYNELVVNSYAAQKHFGAMLSPVLGNISGTLVLLGIASFFVLIVAKYFVASSRDAKRRLRLLYWGMFLAVVPTLSLVVVSIVQKKAIDDYPKWVELPALLLTFLFPVTLAYSIVAHKAMDITVVLRQGMQYTLARRGVGVLQGLLTGGLLIAIARLVQSHQASSERVLVIISLGLALILLLGRVSKRSAKWIDRRFFRDSYDAEQLLMELSEQVRTIVEMHPLLETVARRISESLHVPQVAVLLHGGTAFQLAYGLGYESAVPVSFSETSGTVQQLIEAKQPTRVYLQDANNWVNRTAMVGVEERGTLEKLQAELLIPLLAMGRLLGFISLGQKRSEEPYSRTDLKLLGSVAAQTGLALENARLTSAVAEEAAQRESMRREVEIAREVQERLFPQNLPTVDGLDYCGLCRPARGVGGDYYDFLLLPDGALGVAVGDVSGKGISAALMMASLQASLRGQTMLGPENMAALVERVNRLVYEVSSPERYATFFFAQYNGESRMLTYVNAGHNPPMVLSKCGEEWKLRRLEVGGTVVGLLPQFTYSQDSLRLNPGDVLVAFTDGISEAMNGADEEWGEESLLETLKSCDGKCARETVACIMAAADEFTAGTKQYDDMTVVVMKVAG